MLGAVLAVTDGSVKLPAEGFGALLAEVAGTITAGTADVAERWPTEYPKPKKQAQMRARTKKRPRMVPGPREISRSSE